MQLGSRRSCTSAAAAAKIGGSVVGGWDSRTKMDQAGNGGGVVVNQQPESCGVGGGLQVYHRRLRRNQIGGGGSSSDKKKKSWKSEPVEEIEERPIRVIRKTRSDSYRRVVVVRHPPAAAAEPSSPCFCKEKEHSSACAAGDVSGKDSIHIIRKTKSDSSSSSSQHNINRYLPPPGKADSIQNSTTTTSTTGSDCHTSSRTDYDEMGGGTTTTAEKMNLSNSNNAVGQIETRRLTTVVDEDVIIDGDEKVVVSAEEEEIEIEIEVNVAPEVEELGLLKKTWNLQDNNTNKEVDDNRIHVIHDETPSLLNTSTTAAAANYAEAPPSSNDEFEQLQEFQYKLQSVVDLVMWKDVSKSAFVFGFGSFILLSSSYTKHLNFSMISAISYVGLFYLAAVFFYKSILRRGGNINIDTTEESSSQMHLVVGEDEAVWLLRLILPYLNAFLFKFRSLFSGDPATTLLLAVILFVLARCGNSITTWKMAKLGFVGVFTIPKVCSSYALQLSASGKFWIRRFRDAWDSCSHKKVVASVLFTLVWNLFSLTARVWAAFMLVVAIRYYQQQQSFSMLREEYWEDEQEDLKKQEPKAHNNNHTESMKEKKGS